AFAVVDAEAGDRGGSEACHMPDRLVAEDQRAARFRIFKVIGPVAAADAAQFDAQKPTIVRQRRLRELAHFGAPDVVGDRGGNRGHAKAFLLMVPSYSTAALRIMPTIAAEPASRGARTGRSMCAPRRGSCRRIRT